MEYASLFMSTCYLVVTEMDIIIKLFLIIYLLAMVLITILSVVWILTAIFTPELGTKKPSLMKFQKKQ